jgi:hypothetical protein
MPGVLAGGAVRRESMKGVASPVSESAGLAAPVGSLCLPVSRGIDLEVGGFGCEPHLATRVQ